MRALRLVGLPAAVLACSLLVGPSAFADNVGYQLNAFEPPPAGDPYTVVEYPWYSGTRAFAAGLTLDYAHNLIVSQHHDAAGNVVADPAPIASQLDGHLDLAASFWDRLGLNLSVPMVLHASGTPIDGIGPSGTVVGDPRLGARVRLWGQPDTAFTLGLSGYVWIPVGAEKHLAGDSGARLLPRLTLGGLALENFRWAANAGFLARSTAHLSSSISPVGNTVGSQIQLAAAVSYLALEGRLSVGPEAVTDVAVSDIPAGQSRATVEVLGGAHYLAFDTVQVGLAAGAALTPGPPDFRVIFSIAWAPLREQLSSFERVVVVPDADGHVGGVEVDDGKQKAVLDTAYASSELSKDDGVLRPVQSSPQAVASTVGALERTLPPPDRDHDGVPDAQDACPDRPGAASPDPIRNGCPTSSEKVVVLPDADGHVGGVEVNDGRQKILLDAPWMSSEVGVDGRAQAVPPSPAKSVEGSVGAIAASLPPSDRDADGIADADDACPDRPGLPSTDPVRNGCPKAVEKVVILPDPDGTVGGVEVDDGKQKTLLDKPFASAEVGADGAAHALPPTSPRSIEHAVAAMARTLPSADRDGDGVRDEDDACPDRAGVPSRNPLANGCPAASERVVVLPDANGHVGGVEVNDGKTVTVLDKAYSSAEVSADGHAQAVSPSPAWAVNRAVLELAKAFPADRDGDGVLDVHDACPDRAGDPSEDPKRNGCPHVVERVVVLPDADGHVGAVEVDDGHTKTLLDTAYATALVGSDGRADRSRTDPALVVQHFGPAMAARPVGARMVIYFNSLAQPARDLTGPIDQIVGEVGQRRDFTIDVIGHTDETGSEAANVRIGLARAQLIVDRLVAAGIPREKIRASSRGSSQPAVKVRNRRIPEPKNRRVEVFVN
ncbi:MAG: OmpA family protein [Deltaproteobacteria bacterium]|nr:OmpA family protein [Deltaproteobacteria bacterium]